MRELFIRSLVFLTLFSAQGAWADNGYSINEFSDIEQALGGQIPFPPETFLKSLIALDQQSMITSAIFPHGRSLERSVTSFRYPRSVVSWQSGNTSTPYRLFLGYTPAAEQLEVISWNWQKRKYDFAIISDYAAGKKPKIRSIRPSLCMACHQSGAPIFPEFPWGETTQNPMTLKKIREDGQDSLSRFLINQSREPANRIRLDTSTFDHSVKLSNELMQSQAICTNACGGDLECRKGILLAALLETISRGNSSHIPTPWVIAMNQAMPKVWPSDGFSTISEAIADRFFKWHEPYRFTPEQDPLKWRDPRHAHDAVEGTGRNMLARYATCWNFTREQTEKLRSLGDARLDSAMNTEQMTTLVREWLPSEAGILASLSSATQKPQMTRSPLHVTWSPSPAAPAAISGLRQRKQEPLKLFQRYCMSCHSNASNRPPVLPLDDLAALSSYVGSGDRTVKGLLDPSHPHMPPRGAAQPTVEERLEMISALE